MAFVSGILVGGVIGSCFGVALMSCFIAAKKADRGLEG